MSSPTSPTSIDSELIARGPRAASASTHPTHDVKTPATTQSTTSPAQPLPNQSANVAASVLDQDSAPPSTSDNVETHGKEPVSAGKHSPSHPTSLSSDFTLRPNIEPTPIQQRHREIQELVRHTEVRPVLCPPPLTPGTTFLDPRSSRLPSDRFEQITAKLKLSDWHLNQVVDAFHALQYPNVLIVPLLETLANRDSSPGPEAVATQADPEVFLSVKQWETFFKYRLRLPAQLSLAALIADCQVSVSLIICPPRPRSAC